MKKLGLTQQILLGMAAGFLVGAGLNAIGNDGWIESVFTTGIFKIVGQIFLALLNLLVVPIVFVSLVCGTASLEDAAKLGRVGIKSILLFLTTTSIAIAAALAAALVVKPGIGLDIETASEFSAGETPPFADVIINIFPTNPLRALAEGNMLQIIVFAILFGLAMTLSGASGRRVLTVFEDLNEIIMKLVMLVMRTAPIGVFALIAGTFAAQGVSAIVPLAKYFFLVIAVLVFHGLFVYSSILTVLARLNPITFLRKMRTAQLFAFSTSSSNATIPVNLATAHRRLGAAKGISSFTIPLGATINMDGTAIMQGVATVFIAQAYGVPLAFTDYLMVIVTATMASIGTAGVPGVGLIMLAMVLNQVGLPVEGIGLILGVDRLLDMLRTVVNITGDAMVTCIVAKSENQFDATVFNTPESELSEISPLAVSDNSSTPETSTQQPENPPSPTVR